MNEENIMSRRKAIGGLGAALTTLVVSRGMAAAEETPATNINAETLMENPATKYPKPPFEGQIQPWPGLASRMKPRPDHGEESYQGFGRLAGRKALITGGDSGMGRAAAIAYAREGADVAINYFPTEEPDAEEVIRLIQAAGRKAVPIPGDLRDEMFCQKLVEQTVKELGGLDIVVNNAGRQQAHAAILEISTEQFDWTMKTNIYVQLAASDASYANGQVYGSSGGSGQP
jgi:hypothetical protein